MGTSGRYLVHTRPQNRKRGQNDSINPTLTRRPPRRPAPSANSESRRGGTHGVMGMTDLYEPDENDCVIPHQAAVYAYQNKNGDIVICQRDQDGDHSFVIVHPEYTDHLILALQRIVREIAESSDQDQA